MSRITYETNRYVEKSLSSSALGDNLLKYIEITGVVQIDMFKLIQKDYNLSSYKLNSVSSHFLQGKAEINFENNTVLTNSVDGIFVDNQISFIDQYENYVKEGFKFTITDITDNIITLKEDLKPYFELHNEDIIEEFTAQNHDFKKYPIVLNGMTDFVINFNGRSLDQDFSFGKNSGYIKYGLNLIYDYKIALRLGKNNQDSFSIGIGLSWDNISLDYAMINEPSQTNFGTSNIVSLVLDVNWLQKTILNL